MVRQPAPAFWQPIAGPAHASSTLKPTADDMVGRRYLKLREAHPSQDTSYFILTLPRHVHSLLSSPFPLSAFLRLCRKLGIK